MLVDISLELPEAVVASLAQAGDLSCELKEAMGVELYRQEKITHFQLSKLLGVDRFETDGIGWEMIQQWKLHPSHIRDRM